MNKELEAVVRAYLEALKHMAPYVVRTALLERMAELVNMPECEVGCKPRKRESDK